MLVHPRVGAATPHVGTSRGYYCPQPPPVAPPLPVKVKTAGTFLLCPLLRFSPICGLRCQSTSSRSISRISRISSSSRRRRGNESQELVRQWRREAVQLPSSAHAVPTPTDVEESELELELDGTPHQRQGFDFSSASRSLGLGSGSEDGEWLRLRKTDGREKEEENEEASMSSSSSSSSRLVVELDNLEKEMVEVNPGTPTLLQGAAVVRLDNGDERSAVAAGEWEGLEEERSSENASVSGRGDDDGAAGDPVGDHSTSRQAAAANRPWWYLNSKQHPLSTGQQLLSSDGGIDVGPEPSQPSEPSESEAEDVEYYVPKVGDVVIGVIVSGNSHKLEVDIGSKKLGRILSKDVRPLDSFRSDEFFWEMADGATSLPEEVPLTEIRFLGDGEGAWSTSSMMLPVGSVLSLQVFGVSMGGRPMLTGRTVASSIAWERVRQIHEQDEPIRVQCAWWNSDGLVCKIEGLRALLPWQQFVTKSIKPKSLKEHVGEWRIVLITDVNEAEGKLLLSEKRAWVREGTLVAGTVKRIFPYGVEVILTGTTLRAMIHISQISNAHIANIQSIFDVGETVKAVIVKSPIPHRIALSTAHLETRAGLILQDKEKVFEEAEEMAARYRESLPEAEGNIIETQREFNDLVIANEDWLDFEG